MENNCRKSRKSHSIFDPPGFKGSMINVDRLSSRGVKIAVLALHEPLNQNQTWRRPLQTPPCSGYLLAANFSARRFLV